MVQAFWSRHCDAVVHGVQPEIALCVHWPEAHASAVQTLPSSHCDADVHEQPERVVQTHWPSH